VRIDATSKDAHGHVSFFPQFSSHHPSPGLPGLSNVRLCRKPREQARQPPRDAVRSVIGMNHVQEVQVQTRGPTEGTRHRGDKGTFGGKPARRGRRTPLFTARACLEEVVGA